MSVNAIPRRRSAIPWLVVMVALIATSGVVFWRYRAVTRAAEIAVGTAEGHFNDVVTDHERRIGEGQREIDLVLLGAIVAGSEPGGEDELVETLDRLGAETLVGLRGIVLERNSRLTTLLSVDEGLSDSVLRQVDTMGIVPSDFDLVDQPSVYSSTVDGRGVLVVVLGGAADYSLWAVFNSDEFIFGPPQGTQHHVAAELVAPEKSARPAADGAVGEGSEIHPHDDEVLHAHGASAKFASQSVVDVYGEPWTLDVYTMDGFIEIPSSREVPVVALFGFVSSLLLFGLVWRLVGSRLAAENQLHLTAQRFDTGFERSPIGVAELDETGAVIKANDAIGHLLGRARSEMIGTHLGDLAVDEASQTEPGARALSVDGGSSRLEVRYELDDGRELWVHQSTTAVTGPDGTVHTLVQLVDVTEQRQARDELERQALHDDLTGLPNRALLDDRLAGALSRARRNRLHTAVLFIDVDRFKQVNDSLGHTLGDKLLMHIGQRLSDCARTYDTVARFGGDEFVMLCEELDEPAEALRVADRVREALAVPVEIDGRLLKVSVSLGVAVAVAGDDCEALLRDADLAMYHAKDAGRDRAVLFDQEMRESLVERLALEDELRAAIDSDELRVAYQPLFDLRTDRIVSFEALVRWEHPTRGLVSPDSFLSTAGELGLLTSIDAWVLRTAATQLRAWSDYLAGAEDWGIAVNASAGNFSDPSYPGRVRAVLGDAGVYPGRLTVEVTEQAVLANVEVANKVINDLRVMGVKVAIDDFGTGYSSFSQVASLAFDVLKIDRSLIRRLGDPAGGEVVKTVIQMAHSLGLVTVAEGVESADDLAHLRTLGSDLVQGFFISKPVPPEEVPGLFPAPDPTRAAMIGHSRRER